MKTNIPEEIKSPDSSCSSNETLFINDDSDSDLVLEDNDEFQSIPNYLICPLSKEIMFDPVFAADGYTYSRMHISEWLQTNTTSPITRKILEHTMLIKNHMASEILNEWYKSPENLKYT